MPLLFTGKDRVTETGFDSFGAGDYRANIRRFTTVDPACSWQSARAQCK